MRVGSLNDGTGRQVLISHRRRGRSSLWLRQVETVLRPRGLSVCPTWSPREAVRLVEDGGLAAAVLVADDPQCDVLSLLRVIRSIDDELPCWLVTPDPCRRTLQAASSLRVTGVMGYPIEVQELTLALRKLLVN